MTVGLLEVEGTIEVGQFWPEGRSDADTTEVVGASRRTRASHLRRLRTRD
ncbi:hypothetical protein [Bradyrhizobium sp. 23AC]